MKERDEYGRFLPGNGMSRRGGQKRALQLSSRRRSEIGRIGWRALVERRFYGDSVAQKEWLGQLGAWASDQIYPDWMKVFPHPGSPEEFMAKWKAQKKPLDFALDELEPLSF